eukprot:8572434-Lingulodinium_polyedra.AAC.1
MCFSAEAIFVNTLVVNVVSLGGHHGQELCAGRRVLANRLELVSHRCGAHERRLLHQDLSLLREGETPRQHRHKPFDGAGNELQGVPGS